MNPETRERIRDNAKYLRQVRPIDPEEIYEYVEGEPHPAVVRQVLREEAPDLGLIEREDGTFAPVEEGPLSVDFDGVDALPDAHARRLEDRLVAEFGAGWPEGESGDRLRERIRAVKERYLRQQSVDYDDLTALSYAVYHLPDYYAATQYVLADLAADGLLPNHLRVLDVGAGVGGPALGLIDLLPEDALVEYEAVEPGAGADVLEAMLDETDTNVHASVHREAIEDFEPGDDGEYDLVLFANVLSELDDPEAVLRESLDWLAEDGSVVALAPADRNTATGLREYERAVADRGPATVYAPTVRLWPGESPDSESWSFDVKPDLDVPGFQRRLDEAATESDHEGDREEPSESASGLDQSEREPSEARRHASRGDGEFVNVDVQYAYSVLRTDGRTGIAARGDRSRVARMADAEDLVTNRVDLMAVKLSHDLADGGNPLYLIGDGSQQDDFFAVLTEEDILNADLRRADYGELLSFENALVLWNDDEGAYNVVVDDEAVVDRVPP
ncbi:small ribosomal subunit Rsm22 family protein [Halomicrobium urmianum]|uniref:small ribosomal subunit Rsm22 family protein n=1 Tax=Halomicrobium urmianum TaxID=1586233 RepID=UPI001CD918D8|nr:class I SAM-dependent methyltransferase [Halomicrobium urmianum]